VLVVDPLRAREVTSARQSSCAILPDGRTACWGNRFTNHRQSRDTLVEPLILATALRFSSIRAGEGYMCGLAPEGRAYCWGSYFLGSSGFGEGHALTVVPALGERRFESIAVGASHLCAVDAAGAAHCAILFTGGRSGTFAYDDTRITLPAPARAIAASGLRTCARVGDDIYCWDARAPGVDGPPFTPATRVATGVAATELALSGRRLCVLDAARRARCTSLDAGGVGTAWSAPLGDVTLVRFAVGPFTVCGIDAAAALRCAGSNYAGLLMAPPGVEPSAVVVERAPDGTGWARVSLGDYTPVGLEPPFADPHACAITVGGRTYCWGAQSAGQLGSPSEVTCVTRAPYLPCSPTPLPVPSVRG
jgi:hypothetical protein